MRLGYLLERAGRSDEAAATYEAVLLRWPQRADVRVRVASLLLRSGHDVAARLHLERVLADDPENVAALNNLALLAANDDAQLDAASALVARAVACEPSRPALHDTSGFIAWRRGAIDAARADLQRALDLSNGTYAEAHYHMALVDLSTDDVKRGAASLRRALALDYDSDAEWSADARRRLADLR